MSSIGHTMRIMRPVHSTLLLLFIVTPILFSQVYRSNEIDFRIETLVSGLSHPWSLALIESDTGPIREAFITLRSGTMYFISNIPLPGYEEQVSISPIDGLPNLFVRGQGGLLDVIIAEKFRMNSMIYFSTAKPGQVGQSGTAVYSAYFNRDQMRLDDLGELFSLELMSRSNIHFGSRLTLGHQGDLFFSVGDRGKPERAQDRDDAAGSIMRIPLNFRGMPTGEATNYSFGHRNIQGLFYDEDRDLLFAHEHGPRGGDEINLILPNANYGWPLVSYGINYNGTKVSEYQSLPGITEPLIYWDPSIAPSGFSIYPERGVFAPAGQGWSGQFFIGALAGKHLKRVGLSDSWNESPWPLNDRAEEEEILSSVIGRIRDVHIDELGYIYLLTDEAKGGLYRLIPLK